MTVSIQTENRVSTIVLDRPDRRNAIDRTTANALAEAFRAFDADDEADVAVLFGAHGTFCSGADLTGGTGTAPSGSLAPKTLSIVRDEVGPAALALHRLPKPTIARTFSVPARRFCS